MDKQTIMNQLNENHDSFISYLETLTVEEFLNSKNDKWTAGQQLEHIKETSFKLWDIIQHYLMVKTIK